MLKYSSVTKKLITKSQNLSKLSSKSLFHFTESIENVISILAEGFRHSIIKKDLPLPTYSSSNFNLPGIIKNEFRFKAVCFCDIPLRHINNHKQQYGEYAIGLNKNWAILNGITPVRYVHYYTPDLKNNVFNITRDIAERNFITKHKVINVINEILEDEGSKERVSSDDIEDCPEKIKLLISGYNDLLVAICNHFYSHYGLMRKYEDEWTDRVKGEKRK